jgi:hypothetical protein
VICYGEARCIRRLHILLVIIIVVSLWAAVSVSIVVGNLSIQLSELPKMTPQSFVCNSSDSADGVVS